MFKKFREKSTNHFIKEALVWVCVAIISFTFLGFTLARYVSEGTGGDSARVAKWGIGMNLNKDIQLFTEIYEDSTQNKTTYVKSSEIKEGEKHNVLAPGMNNTLDYIITTFDGLPETAYKYTCNLTVDQDSTKIKDTIYQLDNTPTFKWLFAKPGSDSPIEYDTFAELQGAFNSMSKNYVAPNHSPFGSDLSGEAKVKLGYKWNTGDTSEQNESDTKLAELSTKLPPDGLSKFTMTIKLDAEQVTAEPPVSTFIVESVSNEYVTLTPTQVFTEDDINPNAQYATKGSQFIIGDTKSGSPIVINAVGKSGYHFKHWTIKHSGESDFHEVGTGQLQNGDKICADTYTDVNLPTAASLVYNTTSQRPVWNYDPTQIELVENMGTSEAIDAGTYQQYFKPIGNYCWWDGTFEIKPANWIINRLDLNNVRDKLTATFEYPDYEYAYQDGTTTPVAHTNTVIGLTYQYAEDKDPVTLIRGTHFSSQESQPFSEIGHHPAPVTGLVNCTGNTDLYWNIKGAYATTTTHSVNNANKDNGLFDSDKAYADDDKPLTFYYNSDFQEGDFHVLEAEQATDRWGVPWYGKKDGSTEEVYATSYTSATFDATFAAYHPTQLAWWFEQFEKITSAPAGLEYITTDRLDINKRGCESTFAYLKGITSDLDLSSLNLSNAPVGFSIKYMLNESSGASKIIMPTGISNGKAETLEYMYRNCSSVKEINGISNLVTADCTNICSMFDKCTSLESVDISGWDTQNVTNMSSLFNDCVNLSKVNSDTDGEINLSKFNMQNCKNLDNSFSGCTSMTKFVGPGSNEDKTTHFSSDGCSCSQMFNGCTGMTQCDFYYCDVSYIKNLSSALSGCTSLTSANFGRGVPGKDLTAKCNFNSMFYGDSNLTTIYSAIDVNWHNYQNGDSNMFYGCNNLKGQEGAPKVSASVDGNADNSTYAKSDRYYVTNHSNKDKGYFTSISTDDRYREKELDRCKKTFDLSEINNKTFYITPAGTGSHIHSQNGSTTAWTKLVIGTRTEQKWRAHVDGNGYVRFNLVLNGSEIGHNLIDRDNSVDSTTNVHKSYCGKGKVQLGEYDISRTDLDPHLNYIVEKSGTTQNGDNKYILRSYRDTNLALWWNNEGQVGTEVNDVSLGYTSADLINKEFCFTAMTD